MKKPPFTFKRRFIFLMITGSYYVCACVAYVLDNYITDFDVVISKHAIDLCHNLEHLALGNGSVGLYRNHITRLASNGRGDGSLGIGALVVRIRSTSLTEVALNCGGLAIIRKSHLHLTTARTYYTG